ncbi:serine/threonine-protein kinase [Nocardioides sp. REDSEA-S30_B4]|uniref:serine/threonine-protein kinase n=1 Tax=Nocardioides sp. REDSEA-S30_B4 TaxID=1811552 RepID=UPI0025FC93DB|nr:serine/threonine-protein kinase [Nocardioides sp. REDSEA-S30_B4]
MSDTPARLGRYVVRRRLGSGAFATVWLAYDEQLDSPVAVKVLAENWADDGQVHRRFLEEGRYLRRVESPHVVPVYDAGELPDGRPYLVMAYADQGTLAARYDPSQPGGGTPPTPGQALAVLRQVGSGLQALHDRGVLHRDVKPANVLFRTVEGPAGGGAQVRAMLGDLGLGKALDVSSRLTMIAGTPSYVAPEQAQAESPDARADQYSLGALAYLLLSGRPAFRFTSLQQAADPAPPDPLPGQPAEVDAVVRRALARDPDDRWPDVTTFVEAVEAAVEQTAGPLDEGPTLPWLPLDPDATRAGAGPTSGGRGVTSASEEPRDPAGSRGSLRSHLDQRRTWPYAAASLVLGAVAATGAFLVARDLATERLPDLAVVADASGTLEAEVPGEWTAVSGGDGWTAPQDEAGYPALSVGTVRDWTAETSTGHGVFLALMPGSDLPDRMPGHPECDTRQAPYSESGSQPSRTVVHSGCPGGVTVERVVQVAADRLLWVQVRSLDTATANRVLDSVTTRGI